MIATFVIGLREGLEATLIVGIVAAFLKRNRIALWPMWLGVGLAVLISIGVGVALGAIEQALPQAEQEAMETIIGGVAVVFVTTMILWMRTHARDLKGDLEAEATQAVNQGTAWALAGMAFLAVLKEGFETAVFLLATFQASSNTGASAIGAVIGVAIAAAIGYGLYTGGVRLNLGAFFSGTGIFLVFVAAGLVMTALRTAHEAGWIVIGQQHTVDLYWLAPAGSIRGALITGVLGIQPDPRVVEVVGWFCYLVPALVVSLWPRAWRVTGQRGRLVRASVAGGLVLTAVVLALAVRAPQASVPATVNVRGAGENATATIDRTGDSASLHVTGSSGGTTRFPASARHTVERQGVETERWRTTKKLSVADRPSTMTIDDLVSLFGRVPVGVSPDLQPGPYTAHWRTTSTTTAWTVNDGLLDARRTTNTVLTLSGGGLASTRTLTIDTKSWSVPTSTVRSTATEVTNASGAARELRLWNTWLPIALVIAALWQGIVLMLGRNRTASSGDRVPPHTDADSSDGTSARSPEYAQH